MSRKQYSNHEDLTNSRKEGVYLMAKNGARKNTTLEERINICRRMHKHGM